MKNKRNKVGIVTLGNSTNYGGVLQATALFRTLKQLGYEPTLITCQKMDPAWKTAAQYVKYRVKLYGAEGLYTKLRIVGGIGKNLLSNIHYGTRKAKIKSFQTFIRNNLKTTEYIPTAEIAKDKCSDYDLYVVGSDQVWNFAFNFGEFDERYLLSFAPEKAKKYSYAASTGGIKTKEYIQELYDGIKDFTAITVREESLEQQLREAGAEVKTVLDPTFLLDKETWLEFEKKPEWNLPSKYILVYYLEKSSKDDPVIKEVAEKTGLPVIDIGTDYGKSSYDRMVADTVGPAEFLYLASHASFVITNSFHMTVFSLLFEKRFLVLTRVGQESRVEDLLQKLDMRSHLIGGPDEWKIIMEDYQSPLNRLKEQKAESIEFLLSMRDHLDENSK